MITWIKAIPFQNLMESAYPAALRFGGAGLQLLVTILIARFLGVKESGVYFFWVAVMLEAGQVATFGLDRLAVQQLPRLKRDPISISGFLAPLRATALIMAVVLAGILCLYSFWTQEGDHRSVWWYAMILACVSGITLSFINAEAMTGLGHPVLSIFYRHTLTTVILLLAIVISGTRLTADIALIAYAGSFCICGFGTMIAPGFRGLGRPLKIPTKTEFTQTLGKGFPIFLNSLFASLAFLIPLGILERVHPSEELALFTTGFRIILLFSVLANAIYSLQMPDLSRAAHVMDVSAMGRIYRGAAGKGIILLSVPLVVAFVFAHPVMEVFGEGFGEGVTGLRIMLGFAMLSLVLGPAIQLLLMVGRMKEMAVLAAVEMLVVGAAGFLVVPRYGAEGMAFVVGASLVLEKVLYIACALHGIRKPSSQPESLDS